jgi:hypothetical protein
MGTMRVEDGEVTGPVHKFKLADNILELAHSVEMIGDPEPLAHAIRLDSAGEGLQGPLYTLLRLSRFAYQYLTAAFKSGLHAEPFNPTAASTVCHGVLGVPQSKQDKKDGLKKHQQQQREKKQQAKMRRNVSLPAGYHKKK